MSLLAGIKFVPKEHRDQNNREKDKKATKKSHKHHHRRHRDSDSSDSSDSDDDKRKKKEKKDKSDRHHWHKRHRDASSSSSETERKSKNKDDNSKRRKNEESDEEDDPFAVMRNFSAAQHQDRNISSLQTTHQSNTTNQTIVDSTKPKEFDASKFRSLLAGLTGNATSNVNSVEDTRKSNQSDKETEEEMDYYSSRPSTNSEVPSEAATNHNAASSSQVTSAVNSNHNMAAMLRQRLKSGQSLASSSSSNSGNKLAGTNSDLHLAMQRQQLVQRATDSLKDGGKPNDLEGPSLSIQQLMQQEKFANDADMDLVFAKNVLRMGGKYAGNDFGSDKAGMDEEAAIDMRMYQQKAKPVTDLHQQMKQDFRQLKQRQEKKKRALDSCRLCQAVSLSSSSSSGSTSNTSSSYASQLEICRGDFFLLRLKASGYRLSPTHCELIPLEHTPSLLLYPSHCTSSSATSSSSTTAHASSNRIDETTEAVWKEFRRFVTAFRRMRHNDDNDTVDVEHSVIVMESAAHRGSHDLYAHTVIDLVPVPSQLVDEIVMSFKMAFNEESSDWAQHRSQIALSRQKPLVTAIPKHFPYYFVEWAEDTGVVHPIDDGSSNGIAGGVGDTAAGRDTEDYGARAQGKTSVKDAGFFCFDVLAVAMEEDEARWRRTRPSETPAQLQAVKTRFLQKWRPVSASWATNDATIGK